MRIYRRNFPSENYLGITSSSCLFPCNVVAFFYFLNGMPTNETHWNHLDSNTNVPNTYNSNHVKDHVVFFVRSFIRLLVRSFVYFFDSRVFCWIYLFNTLNKILFRKSFKGSAVYLNIQDVSEYRFVVDP